MTKLKVDVNQDKVESLWKKFLDDFLEDILLFIIKMIQDALQNKKK